MKRLFRMVITQLGRGTPWIKICRIESATAGTVVSIIQAQREKGKPIARFRISARSHIISEVNLGRRKKLINNTNIPQHEIETIARCIMPDILALFESEEGQQEFAAWKAQREAEAEQNKRNTKKS